MDLQGFSTPQQGYEGLFKLGDDLRQKKYAEEQRDYQPSQALAGRKDANDKYFTNLLNPKDYLTGTHYDPNTIKLLQDATQQAYELSSKGADMNQITMAIAPLVGKVADYSSKAKMYQAQKKQILEKFKGKAGYDMEAIDRILDEETFYRTDPKTGERVFDVDAADPSLRSPMERILTSRLHEITNNKAFSAWGEKSTVALYDDEVGDVDRLGNKTKTKLKTQRVNWAVPEKKADGSWGFVPKYDVAADNQIPITHEFTQPDGKKVNAPIRLVDEDVYQQVMRSEDGAADYIKGIINSEMKEYRDPNGNPVTPNSPYAQLVARAIIYDELKPLAGAKSIVKTGRDETLSNIQVKINAGVPLYTPPKPAEGGSQGPVGNVLNTIQVYNGQKDGWYGMNTSGNKTNMAAIQQLLGDNILAQDEIGTEEIKYQVKGGKVDAIYVKGQVYRRGDFDRLQKQLDKEPKWAGSLRYPTDQQRFGAPLQGSGKPSGGAPKGETLADKMRKNKK
jgi:hypothetical protein